MSRRNRMNNSTLIPRLMLTMLAVLLVSAAHAAKPVRSDKPVDAGSAQGSLREVEYTTLESRIGSQLLIQTTNDTTRNGTLLRYTKVSLTLKLGPENGSIELGVPRSTIRKVMLEIGPADPLFPNETSPHEGKPGAKKN